MRRSAPTAAVLVIATLAGLLGLATPSADARATPYRAGQHVNFYASQARCTGAFVIQIATRRGWLAAAVTAGHCSSYPIPVGQGRYARERVWRVRGRNSPPAVALGTTIANVYRGGPDVLAFGLSGIGRADRVVQSGRRELRVRGWVRSSRLTRGKRVCFTGRNSGTHCGRLLGVKRGRGSKRITCTSIRVRGGDSGAPVYTPPRSGRVRAIGLVKASRSVRGRRGMCFTPIGAVLRALHARMAR